MRILTIRAKGEGTKEFFIYESETEINEAGINYKHIYWDKEQDCPDIAVGDYIRTDNGYYLPVRKIYRQLYKYRLTYRYRCPMLEFSITKNVNTNQMFRKQVFYYPDVNKQVQHNLRKTLTKNRRWFVALMRNGVDFMTAAYMAYPRGTRNIMEDILKDDAFIQYLIHGGYMKKLKDEMIDAGITAAYFASKVKDILDDEKASNDLKRHCLTIAKDILSKEDVPESAKGITSEKVDMEGIRNRIMGSISN